MSVAQPAAKQPQPRDARSPVVHRLRHGGARLHADDLRRGVSDLFRHLRRRSASRMPSGSGRLRSGCRCWARGSWDPGSGRSPTAVAAAARCSACFDWRFARWRPRCWSRWARATCAPRHCVVRRRPSLPSAGDRASTTRTCLWSRPRAGSRACRGSRGAFRSWAASPASRFRFPSVHARRPGTRQRGEFRRGRSWWPLRFLAIARSAGAARPAADARRPRRAL